eukprot:Nk52_evm44s1671 gene=Nk52_evmTU44s1671
MKNTLNWTHLTVVLVIIAACGCLALALWMISFAKRCFSRRKTDEETEQQGIQTEAIEVNRIIEGWVEESQDNATFCICINDEEKSSIVSPLRIKTAKDSVQELSPAYAST